jgi:hypothetical protein
MMRFLAFALVLGGCIYESGGSGGSGGGGAGGGVGGQGGVAGGPGDGGAGGPGGLLQVAWNLYDLNTNALIPCRQEETVLISVLSPNVFPCSAMSAQISLPAGTYDVSVYLLDGNRMVEANLNAPGVVIQNFMQTNLGAVPFRVPNSIGDLLVTWEVDVGGQAVGCQSGELVEIGLGTSQLFDFDCFASQGTMMSIRAGAYTLSSLLHQGMITEATGPTLPITVQPYTVTNAAHIVFQR